MPILAGILLCVAPLQGLDTNAWSAVRSGRVPPTAVRALPGVGRLSVYHYPGMSRVRAWLEPTTGVERASATLRMAGRTVPFAWTGGIFTACAETPSEPGAWPLDIEVATEKGTNSHDAVCTLERRRHEWEGHRIGLDRVIVPPFTPLAYSGGTIDVLKRRYRLGAACLPHSIVAEGRELLAAPIRFEALVDGRRLALGSGGTSGRSAEDGYDATLDGQASDPDSEDGVTISAKGRFEYDGFLWNEFTLSGLAGRRLDRFTLVVPMKDAEAPLMHVCMPDSLRYNPARAVPQGDGEVWNGTKLWWGKASFRAPQLAPYVWLGAERRGLSWFVNNTCGFRLDASRSAMRLIRRDGALNLEIDIVNVPSRLPEGHSFAFGFEATPVKDPDPRLRRHFQTGPGQHPAGTVSRQAINYTGVGFWNNWARRPYGDDWRLFEAACRLAATGAPDDAARYRSLLRENSATHDRALEEHCRPLPVIGKETPYFLWLKGCRIAASQMILAPGEPVYPFKYSDPTLNWTEEDAQRDFRAEWVSRECRKEYIGAERNFLTPSCLDYVIYHYRKETQLGMKGIYLDDMFPMTCRNPDTCCRVDSDGSVHGNFGILEMRELVKRLAVMQHLAGVSPRLLQVHMTNCLLVPSFAFATSQLSWEDHFGEDEFQKRFADGYVRAESLGGQIGAEAVALDGIKRRTHPKEGWDARFRFLTRTQQAMLLPAGVKIWLRPPWPPDTGVHKEELFRILDVPGRFGAWEEDCRFTSYFEYDGSAGAVPREIHVGTYRRGGGTLWVFGNQTSNDLSFAISPVRPVGRLEDGETGAALHPGDTFRVPAYDLRFALATPPPAP